MRPPASTTWPPRAGRTAIAARPAAASAPGCSSAATSGSARACHHQASVTAGTVMHEHPHPASAVVLGRLPGRHPHPGDLGQAASAPARPHPLRDRLAHAPEAAPGDGRPRARAPARRGRGRRGLRRRRRLAAQKPAETASESGSSGSPSRSAAAARGGCGSPRCPTLEQALARSVGRAATSSRSDRPHRRLARLRRRSPALGFDHRPIAQRWRHEDRQVILPARPPRALQPQDLASGHPPQRLRQASAGLPRRVRLSPQPPPHPDGGLPDAARARRHPPRRPPMPRSPLIVAA